MEKDEMGCQAPEGPILCINNCGFFGSAATMNMCSVCHKNHVLKQEQAKLAATSIGNIVNGTGSSSSNAMEIVTSGAVDLTSGGTVEPQAISAQPSEALVVSSETVEAPKPKDGPNRCNACKKRVGLMGFSCRCGNLFCSMHRYSDKHDCPFDYRTAGRDAIAKANPVVKAEKVDKI
ncbi:Zinc finger A20 and AN1 domain-containing stress-associated protein 8 [Acorus gramineus]|uniref:Zinc finger A20 and AN1 domain-containing stress-associated protein 8 n=1 Tax=Acorus gramineus TaxID=55184 RepID=A0AAV9A5R6_ACOGR|nr:Zinc finger A20 and AN1 domain-containing stress-associated protein 8 [Acorus gramineus]